MAREREGFGMSRCSPLPAATLQIYPCASITPHVPFTLSHHGPPAHIRTLPPGGGYLITWKLLSARIIPNRTFHLIFLPIAHSYLFLLSSLVFALFSFFSFLLLKKADNDFGIEKFLLPPSSLLLRYNWHITLYNFRVYNVMIGYLYMLVLNSCLWGVEKREPSYTVGVNVKLVQPLWKTV